MKIWVLKNPNATTRAITSATPREGWEEMEEADFIAWRDAQPELVVESQQPPEQVTKRQLLHWLEFDHGVADPEAAIDSAIRAAISDPAQLRFALADWSRTYYVRRDNALVPLLAAVLQIADVDAAFREMEEKYG